MTAATDFTAADPEAFRSGVRVAHLRAWSARGTRQPVARLPGRPPPPPPRAEFGHPTAPAAPASWRVPGRGPDGAAADTAARSVPPLDDGRYHRASERRRSAPGA